MEHEYISYLKENNISLKVLRVDNSPLIISFLFRTFKKKNRTVILGSELATYLNDYIYFLNQNEKNNVKIYPLSADDYLQKWTNDGYLRSWYEVNNDEPLFELTPAAEKAIEWLIDLEKKDFIGTESRLKNIFNTLKDLAYKNTYTPDRRISELEKQKAEIEQEIAKIKAGNLEKLDSTKTREIFLNAEENARKLLADFKQVEQNFRELDSDIRQKYLNTEMSKGKVLDEIFHIQDLIWDSDQGKSFRAFWEFMMSRSKQEELNELIELITGLPDIQDLKKDNLLERLKMNLIEAGDKVHKSNSLIIEQLRKFLSDQLFIENRRIMDLIKSIETYAFEIKENPPAIKEFISIDDRVRLELVMDKPLFTPPDTAEIAFFDFDDGFADISTLALYQQLFIDLDVLKENIRNVLKGKNQATLAEITEVFPIEKGLAELISYLGIAAKDNKAVINDNIYEKIVIFNNESNKYSEVEMPKTIFSR